MKDNATVEFSREEGELLLALIPAAQIQGNIQSLSVILQRSIDLMRKIEGAFREEDKPEIKEET